MKKLLPMILALAFLVTGQAPVAHAQTGQIKHVILFVEENHSFSSAMNGMPFLSSMAKKYAYASNYQATTHPSLPNYLAMTGGSTFGVTTDCSPSKCSTSSENIFHQLGSAWAVWAESEPSPCWPKGADPYTPRHTAAPYYSDLSNCKQNDVAYPSNPSWGTDKFVFAIPNLNHDAHDGSLSSADSWLKQKVTQLMGKSTYQDGSTLIEVTFDEGSGDNHVLTVFINPALNGKVLTGAYTHYGLLRLNEELLGNRLIGHSADSKDIRPALGL